MSASDFSSQTVPDLFSEASAVIEKALNENKVDLLLTAFEAVSMAEVILDDARSAAKKVAIDPVSDRLLLITSKIEQGQALKKRIKQAYDEILPENDVRPTAEEFFQDAAAGRKR